MWILGSTSLFRLPQFGTEGVGRGIFSGLGGAEVLCVEPRSPLRPWCAFWGEFLAKDGGIFLPVRAFARALCFRGRVERADLAGGQPVGNCMLTRRGGAIVAFYGRRARRVGHRGPMLFRNPFPMDLYSLDRRTADLAGVDRPLLSVSVSGKNFLQIIAELSIARFYGCWHHFPFIWIRCGKTWFST